MPLAWRGWRRASPPRREAGGLAGAVEIALAAILMWWLPRTIAEVALWKMGSIVYLWAVAGEVWLVRRVLMGASRPGRIGLAVVAFAIATFLETLSVLVAAVLLAWCLWCRYKHRAAPVGVLFGQVAGTAVVLLAPGNMTRAATMPEGGAIDRIVGVVGNLGSLFDLTWLAAVAVLVVAYLVPRSPRHSLPSVLRAGHGWIFVALAMAYMLMLLGLPRAALTARVSFPASVCLVIYVLTLFVRRPMELRTDRWIAGGLAALVVAHLAVVVPDLTMLARIYWEWEADPQLRLGPLADVVLPHVMVKGRAVYIRKHIFFTGFSRDPQYFVNQCYAKAKGVKSITAR